MLVVLKFSQRTEDWLLTMLLRYCTPERNEET